jgi:hypothetical protein
VGSHPFLFKWFHELICKTDVHNGDHDFQQHMRAELKTELHTLLHDKVPQDAKYSGVRSPLKRFIESAFDSGLVEEAINRVTYSFKKRRRMSDSEGEGEDNGDVRRRVRPYQEAKLPRQHGSRGADGGVEPCTLSPVTPDIPRPPRQHTQSPAFSTDYQPHIFSFNSLNASSVPNSSFDEAANWHFDSISLGQFDEPIETQSTDQTPDDWFLLPSDPPPTVPRASRQVQGRSSTRGNINTAHPPSPN